MKQSGIKVLMNLMIHSENNSILHVDAYFMLGLLLNYKCYLIFLLSTIKLRPFWSIIFNISNEQIHRSNYTIFLYKLVDFGRRWELTGCVPDAIPIPATCTVTTPPKSFNL